ncbi:MAG: hypothetical protein ABFS41_00325 [Myxococcota bacterium]
MKDSRNFRTGLRGLRGLRVVGPSLYLWDTDAREALRLAAELGVRRRPPPRSARRRAPVR